MIAARKGQGNSTSRRSKEKKKRSRNKQNKKEMARGLLSQEEKPLPRTLGRRFQLKPFSFENAMYTSVASKMFH